MRWRIMLFLFFVGSLQAQQTKFFRTYSTGLYDNGEVVIPINDTNYVVAGSTNTTGMNGTDMLLFQTNSRGDVMWWKNLGGYGTQAAKSAVMAVDSSGYYVVGYSNDFDSSGYNVWLVRTNLSGDTLWTKKFGGSNWEVGYSINKLSDTTYIIAGETFSYGNGQRDVYLIHVDQNGDTLWTRTYGGSDDDIGKFVYVDRNNQLMVVGSTESFGAGMSDAYVLYLDQNGDSIWTKTIGTVNDDFGYSAAGYIDTGNTLQFVIGYTSYYAPEYAQNSYIMRIDSISGNSIAIYPQHETAPDMLDRIRLRGEGNNRFYFTSEIRYGYDEIPIVCALRNNYDFSNLAQNTYGSGGNEGSAPNDMYRCLDGGYIITGYCENWGPGPTSAFLIKTDSMLVAPNTPQIGIEDYSQPNFEVFPNPVVSDHFYINCGTEIQEARLLLISGQEVFAFHFPPGHSVTLPTPDISPGLYLIEITTVKGETFYKKLIL